MSESGRNYGLRHRRDRAPAGRVFRSRRPFAGPPRRDAAGRGQGPLAPPTIPAPAPTPQSGGPVDWVQGCVGCVALPFLLVFFLFMLALAIEAAGGGDLVPLFILFGS